VALLNELRGPPVDRGPLVEKRCPTAIAYGTEDDQRKHLSHFQQQTSTAIDHRIWFLKHNRNKISILSNSV